MTIDAFPAPQSSARSLTARVIAVGGAAGNVLLHLKQSGFAELETFFLQTDSRAAARLESEAAPVILGSKLLFGLGTGGDPELGKAAAEEDLQKIETLCQGADLVFVVAGLGGGAGSGAAPVVARAAKESGALVIGLAILPFEFEGRRRREQAQAGLANLKNAADAVICLPNQKVFRLIDERTKVLEAFGIANELLAQGIRAIWRMLSRTGLIQVDFADLAAVTRGRHTVSALATARAEGPERTQEVVDQVLASPLLDGGQALAEADALLIHLAGGPDLMMSEVDRVIARINRHAPEARLIIGASIDPAFERGLEVTLVVATPAPAAPALEDQGRRSRGAESDGLTPEIETEFLTPAKRTRPSSRFIPPPPELPPEKARQMVRKHRGRRHSGKGTSFWRQGTLQLEIVSKGRFEKSEPTIHRGEDLDVPTYVRRGIALN